MAGSDFAGMTVNERLFVAGLLSRFESAAKEGDREALIALLNKVDLAGQGPLIADSVMSHSDPGVLDQRYSALIHRNRQGREIWFKRWVWSYVPCHWKGWLLLFGVAAMGNAAMWLLRSLLRSQDDDWRPFVVLPAVWIAGLVLADRHSPSRS